MTHTARVNNGRLVLDRPTDLPEGSVIELYDTSDLPVDELDEDELARLHQSIDGGLADIKAGRTRPMEEFIADLRRRGPRIAKP